MADDRPLILCRSDRIGDVLLATSCLEPIRRARPEQRIVFAAREVMRPLLEGHPLLAGFIAIPQTARGQERTARQALADEFCRWDAGSFVALHPDPLSQAAAKLAAIPHRIGYQGGYLLDRTLTEALTDRRISGAKHEAEYNLDLLASFGVRAGEIPLRPSVHLPESWRRSLEVRLAAAGWDEFGTVDGGPYAVVNPTAFSGDLRWPAEHFAWLVRELLGCDLVSRVVLVADRIDDPSMRRIRHLLGPVPGLIDLSGATNLAELGWLLRFARLLVSRNTGTTHLAAAVGCPTVEIFGRTEPRYGAARWRALGERNRIIVPPPLRRSLLESRRAYWRRGHAAVAREDVLAAARSLVETRRHPTFPES